MGHSFRLLAWRIAENLMVRQLSNRFIFAIVIVWSLKLSNSVTNKKHFSRLAYLG